MGKGAENSPKHLAKRQVTTIANLTLEMDITLRPTWKRIGEIARDVTGHAYTRQTLFYHKAIAEAYEKVSNGCYASKKKGSRSRPSIPLDEAKDQKLSRLSAKITAQEELIEAYQELLVRFIGNVLAAGITQEALEADLVPREEWRTDLDHMADKTKEARRKQRRG